MSGTKNPINSDDLVDLGEEHHKAGRLQDAESHYRKALEIDPGHPGALYYLASLAYDDGRLPLATQLVEELLRGDPSDAEAWHLRGVIAHKEGSFSSAVECFNKAVALQPAYSQAYYSLGNTLSSAENIDAALVNFQRAATLNPSFAEAHCAIGTLFQEQQHFEQALSSYRHAIQLKPDFELAYQKIGYLFISLEKWDDAIASFRKAIAENVSGGLIHAGLGAALSAINQHHVAIAHFTHAIALTPDYPEVHHHYGNALQALGRFRETLVSYDKALLLKPDYSEVIGKRESVLKNIEQLGERDLLKRELIEADVVTTISKNIDLTSETTQIPSEAPSIQLTYPIAAVENLHYINYQYAPSRFADKKMITIDGHDVRILSQHSEPEVVVFENVLSDTECDLLIDLARPRLAPSKTVNPGSATNYIFSESRTSESGSFVRGENEFLRTIEKRLAVLMNLPVDHGEGMQILHYAVGAQYEPHHDYFDPESVSGSIFLQKTGQRMATLIMYLNDVDDGGETVFPKIDYAVKPRKGCAVYFSYCDAAGKLDYLTLHGGAPVKSGEKWIATKWVRQRAW